MLELETQPRRRKIPRLFIGLGLIAVAASTIFAANITINNGSKIEFGQGIFQVKACDQWIGITLTSTDVDGTGYSKVQNVIITGLDTTSCKGTNLRISFYKTGVSTPLDMYTGASATGTTTSKYLVIHASSNIALDPMDRLTLVSPAGQNIGYADAYETIDPNFDTNYNFDGSFTVTFKQPVVYGRDVNKIVLESVPAA